MNDRFANGIFILEKIGMLNDHGETFSAWTKGASNCAAYLIRSEITTDDSLARQRIIPLLLVG